MLVFLWFFWCPFFGDSDSIWFFLDQLFRFVKFCVSLYSLVWLFLLLMWLVMRRGYASHVLKSVVWVENVKVGIEWLNTGFILSLVGFKWSSLSLFNAPLSLFSTPSTWLCRWKVDNRHWRMEMFLNYSCDNELKHVHLVFFFLCFCCVNDFHFNFVTFSLLACSTKLTLSQ